MVIYTASCREGKGAQQGYQPLADGRAGRALGLGVVAARLDERLVRRVGWAAAEAQLLRSAKS